MSPRARRHVVHAAALCTPPPFARSVKAAAPASPSRVGGGASRSSSSAAALTFWAPSSVFAGWRRCCRNKRALHPPDWTVRDFCCPPPATRETFCGRAPPSPAPSEPAGDCGGEPSKHQPCMANISPPCLHGNICPPPGLAGLPPHPTPNPPRLSVCLTD